MNIFEKLILIGIVLLLLGSAFIVGMFKGRDMCNNYAQNIACDEEKKCPECTEFDLSYCPTCIPEIRYITETCPLEPDPLEDLYYLDLQDKLAKAEEWIEARQEADAIQAEIERVQAEIDRLKGLE